MNTVDIIKFAIYIAPYVIAVIQSPQGQALIKAAEEYFENNPPSKEGK
jgi:hypothetical protein